MSEEKKLDKDINVRSKLTDEEIVKALDNCKNIEGCCFCTLWEEARKGNHCGDLAIDLIHRLQAKIEHLTEELATAKQELVNEQRYYENAYSKSCQLETQNSELQKQVNDLTEQRDVFKNLFENCNNSSITTREIINVMNSFYREQAEHLAELKIEQTVKDTAKEIFTELLKDENVCEELVDDYYAGHYIMSAVTVDKIKEIAEERYGVEVE